jgi:hypothetical protein
MRRSALVSNLIWVDFPDPSRPSNAISFPVNANLLPLWVKFLPNGLEARSLQARAVGRPGWPLQCAKTLLNEQGSCKTRPVRRHRLMTRKNFSSRREIMTYCFGPHSLADKTQSSAQSHPGLVIKFGCGIQLGAGRQVPKSWQRLRRLLPAPLHDTEWCPGCHWRIRRMPLLGSSALDNALRILPKQCSTLNATSCSQMRNTW